MFTFTNKEKQELLNKIELLELQLKNTQDVRDICKEQTKSYLNDVNYYRWENENMKLTIKTHLKEKTVAEEENTILKAQNSVISKLQDKEDEYREKIMDIESKLELSKQEPKYLQEQIKSLESQLQEAKNSNKELLDKLFQLQSKDPIIVNPVVSVLNTSKK